jgi:hypothetical protein
MMRDGGLKIRTDMFQDLQGRSDNWVSSLNINTSIPKILPPQFPHWYLCGCLEERIREKQISLCRRFAAFFIQPGVEYLRANILQQGV